MKEGFEGSAIVRSDQGPQRPPSHLSRVVGTFSSSPRSGNPFSATRRSGNAQLADHPQNIRGERLPLSIPCGRRTWWLLLFQQVARVGGKNGHHKRRSVPFLSEIPRSVCLCAPPFERCWRVVRRGFSGSEDRCPIMRPLRNAVNSS